MLLMKESVLSLKEKTTKHLNCPQVLHVFYDDLGKFMLTML